ncbi:hypothetical protein OJ997_08070 [Solirubrobacter phytolaccae]|uniref:Uncharacterized protein n=1 Tax=Solirubrobacter phytolaccae TaxID=1404360 RepID=A0A9X3N8K2_9ACTN|nr:hypothetical protein [Solirubrobacter phytolaccae]MDA0180247.1 hypothetical protein [Solirubrobacter phytolaccae]
MRRASLLAGAAVCAGFAMHAAPSEASCIATLKWRTYSYIGVGNNLPGVKIGAAMPEVAKQPACNDAIVNGYVPPPSFHDVPVAQLEGVSPAIAIAAGASMIYVSQSAFPALPSHPLHKVLNLGRGPEVTGAPCQVKGVATTDAIGLYVNGARIIVDPDTKVELQRHGTGFVAPGTTIRVGGRACERKPYGQIWIKARRIARG